MESQLRNALEHNELQLHYQPQLELDNGRVVGVEALLRWQNEKLGNVPPDTFIPIAEDSGLIIPIGEWVLRTACTQLKAWQDTGVPIERIAVNISVRQFMYPGFLRAGQAGYRGYRSGPRIAGTGNHREPADAGCRDRHPSLA